MKNYVRGGETKQFTAGSALSAGVGVKLGPSLVGIVMQDVASGAVGEAMLEGVHNVAKVSAQAWNDGDKVYWDDTAKNFTTTSTSNTFAGTADGAAANPSGTSNLNLNAGYP